MKNETRIVIADDNVNLCQALKGILAEKGYGVDCASDGYELLALLRKAPPRIVILDLMMPGKDGMEIFQSIKAISPETRIIIYTAFDRYRDSIYAKHADRFILKSDDPKRLLDAIEDLVKEI